LKKSVKNIIKTVLFVALGLLLFFFIYKDFDFNELLSELKALNYWWFIPMIAMSIMSHVSRTIRWQMLLESDGGKTRFLNTFLAVMNGYFANIAVPRLGEVTRCGIVSKYDKQDFSKVLGTMVSERMVDVLMLLLFTILAFFLQTTEIQSFIDSNPDFGSKLDIITSIPVIIGGVILAAVGFYLLILIAKGKFNHIKIFAKISKFITSFWQGILSLKKVKRPGWFIFHSIFIWLMYFFMLYVCFFAFEDFNLSIFAALTLFVAGSYGMVAPSPNGIGAYHFMIIQTLIIYGISPEKAASFALIVHGLQTSLLVVAGLISFIALPIINKNK